MRKSHLFFDNVGVQLDTERVTGESFVFVFVATMVMLVVGVAFCVGELVLEDEVNRARLTAGFICLVGGFMTLVHHVVDRICCAIRERG